jgi:dTDP-glucose 4,6-dehydratase
MAIIVTGGCGFIGSTLIKNLIEENEKVINVDKLTYAADKKNLEKLSNNKKYTFVKGDINDIEFIRKIFRKHKPKAIIHLAAESHVDKSISNPTEFINTNVLGTFNLLEASKEYMDDEISLFSQFKFIHISTDEVYGSLDKDSKSFTEESLYLPNSPYSASKAASDHLVRSYYKTYKLPTIITNCSNNYGPNQYPEKLIPLTIKNLILKKQIPIYGNGLQIRDWLHVDDHSKAIIKILYKGEPGKKYNIGGSNELSNIYLVKKICSIFDQIKKNPLNHSNKLITYVDDRLGHDARYSIDSSKIERELSWRAAVDFNDGLRSTIEHYIDKFENIN